MLPARHATSDLLIRFVTETRSMTDNHILYRPYAGESDLSHIMALVQSELSEPYVIYTFRYFLHQWCGRVRSFITCQVDINILTFVGAGPIYLFS